MLNAIATKTIITALLCSAVIQFVGVTVVTAKSTDQQIFELAHNEFIATAFNGTEPDTQRVWIRGDLREQIEKILQHRTSFLRTKYWLKDDVSVWIIDEIGKEKPITSGIIVVNENGSSRIASVKVLAFRETRGWEVKHTFFTDQFKGAHRSVGRRRGLVPSIDGITGATLSVRALKKVAEIALLLDEHVRKQTITNSSNTHTKIKTAFKTKES